MNSVSQTDEHTVRHFPQENNHVDCHFKRGDTCLVRSGSGHQKKWCLGKVVEIDDAGFIIKARYYVKQTKMVDKDDHKVEETRYVRKQKDIEFGSNLIKPFTINDMDIIAAPKCACGLPLMKLENYNIFSKIMDELPNKKNKEEKQENNNDKNEENENDEKSSEEKKDNKCTVCGNIILDNLGYFCPNGKSEIHFDGFYLCFECTMDRMGFSLNSNIRASIISQSNDNDSSVMSSDFDAASSTDVTDNDNDNDNDNKSEKKKEDNDSDDGAAVAQQSSNKPFAKGSSRYAYLGRLTTGQACVLKKFINEHVTQPKSFEAELRCIEKASELIDKWNELGRVNKKYILIKPHLARASNAAFEFLQFLAAMEKLLFGLRNIGLGNDNKNGDNNNKNNNDDDEDNKDENKDDKKENNDENDKDDTSEVKTGLLISNALDEIWKDQSNNPDKKDEILMGEWIIIEPYLNGDFTKWNSNSGWQNPESRDSSVQAFCHWTYHYSKGEYLFCDAQGISKYDKYIITDPCIVSNKEYNFDNNGNIINASEQQVYGVTDVGRQFLLNWFKNHKCNDYCDKTWEIPESIEYKTILPSVVNASKTRASVFNSISKGDGSVTLGSGSMVLAGNNIRPNFTINGTDYSKEDYIWKNEHITMIGSVLYIIDNRQAALNDNSINMIEYEPSVLILTNKNRLLLVNEESGDEEEFTRSVVKEVILKDNTSKFHFQIKIKIKKDKNKNKDKDKDSGKDKDKGKQKKFKFMSFECKDGKFAQQWKDNIDTAFDL